MAKRDKIKAAKDNSKRNEVFTVVILIILGILYYSTRFTIKGVLHYSPEDTFFHLNRLIGLSNVWRSPVNFNSFSGDGIYTNIFYPWLTMYPMWLLYKFCGGCVTAYKIYCTILGIVTILIAYYCFKSISKDRTAAFCFAVLYTFSQYRFADVFRRAALGESIAITFLPIVLLGMYNIFWGDQNRWKSLSAGLALIAFTHMLSLYLTAVIFVACNLPALIWTDQKKQRIISLFKAAIFAGLLSVGALLPIIQTAVSDSVYHPQGYIDVLIDHADSLVVIIRNSIMNVPSAHGVGFLVIMAAFLTLIIMPFPDKDHKKSFLISRIYFISGIVILVFASSTIPWGLIGKNPLFQIIQFPWRLHSYSTLFILAAFSMLIPVYLTEKTKIVISIVVCLLSVYLNWSSANTLRREAVARIADDSKSVTEYINLDYSPVKAKTYIDERGYDMDKFFLDREEITPDHYISEDGNTFTIDIKDGKKGQSLDIPVYWFTSLRARINGADVAAGMSERGTVQLILPEDGEANIGLFHRYTVLTYVSWIISLLTLIGMVFYGKVFNIGEKHK